MNSWRAWLLRTIDTYLGKTLVFGLSAVPNFGVHRPVLVRRIAVIRLWAIGESILALPAISAIKRTYPETKITVITTPYVAPVFQEQSTVDEIVLLRPSPWSLIWYAMKYWRRFDVVLDFEPYLYAACLLAWVVGKWKVGFATRGRQALYNQSIKYNDRQHVVCTNLDLVRVMGATENNPRLPMLHSSAQDKAIVDKIMADRDVRSDQGFILIAPGVGGSARYRMWPWQRFAKLADQLIAKNRNQIVWVGEEKDQMLIDKIQKTMRHDSKSVINASLNQLFYLVSLAQLLIANDSGVMHIGAAMKTPTLGLFGPNTPVRFGPFGENNQSIYHEIESGPCINVHKGEISRKNKQCARAMLAIQADEVNEIAKRMLSEKR